MNYVEEARKLVQNLNQRMSPSTYDIAWMAQLRDPATGELRWPDLIEWLLENQHPDGSWGGQIPYYHDRVICTLAAIIALHENGHTRQAKQAIDRGVYYLWNHLHMLFHDPFELSGFELLFPTLLGEAHSLGLDVPLHTYGYSSIQTAKLRLIPPNMLYSPHISTVYSLEFLGKAGDVNQLQQAVNPSGSVGNSPATTAYYLSLHNHDANVDERALAYLETVQQQDRIFTVYPFRTFELGWVLNNLLFSGLPITEFADQDTLDTLHAAITPTGVALDPTFGISDGDITSVCSHVLLKSGRRIDPLILTHFENPKTSTFCTYKYERNMSISTNVHAWTTLRCLPDYPNQEEVRRQIVLTLLGNREYDTYWFDKWHASPYYATSHILIGLVDETRYLAYECRHTIDWILHNQRDDGSWGFYQGGTEEETAYALTVLLYYRRYEPIPSDTLHRGAAYLARKYQGANSTYYELWLAKSIYAPHDIIRSAILAALILYEETFGSPP